MAELLTRPAFHAGRPGAWAAFRLAEEVYPGGPEEEEHGGFFGQGAPMRPVRRISRAGAAGSP